jgi:hypothetical protein
LSFAGGKCRKTLHTLLARIGRAAQGIGNIEIPMLGMVIADGECMTDQAGADQVATLNEFGEVSRQSALATADSIGNPGHFKF